MVNPQQAPGNARQKKRTENFFVAAVNPLNRNRAPTTSDIKDPATGRYYPIHCEWRDNNQEPPDIWKLVRIANNQALWQKFIEGGSTDDIMTLSDTAGTKTGPDATGNVQQWSSDDSILIETDAANFRQNYRLPDGPETATSNIIVYGGGNFASGYKADYDNITDAVAAASSGDTIFIKEGTYTENITLKAGVNLAAYGDLRQTNNVTIDGKITATHTGVVCLSGLTLTNTGSGAGDYVLDLNLGASSSVELHQCYVKSQNASATQLINVQAGQLICWNTTIDGSQNIVPINMSGGYFSLWWSRLEWSTAVSACTLANASNCDFRWSTVKVPISASGTTPTNFYNCECSTFDNTTFLTTAGTGSHRVENCEISTGSATSLTVGSGTTLNIYDALITTSDTDAIDGAGTINYGGLTFTNGSNISTTTQTIKNEGPSRYIGSTNVGETNELSVRNLDNTNTSSNALVTVTSGGGSGGNASYRACVSGAGCYHWGIDNTDDKLKVSTGDTYLSGNTLLTMDTVGNSTFGFSTAGNTIAVTSENSDNTNANSHSKIEAKTGGASGGDPYFSWNVDGVTSYSYGIDNTDSDKLKITTGNSGPSSGTTLLEMTSAGDTTFSSTGYTQVASGTTAQKPGSPVNGMIRYDTDLGRIEGYSGGSWKDLSAGAGSGDVVGPGSATDNALARFDSTTGKLIQNSTATLSDAGVLNTAELNLTTALDETYGGTGQTTFTTGDILYASGANTLSKLAAGTNGHVLTMGASVPAWSAASGGGGPKVYWFAAESLQPLETNFAPLEKLTGTNQKVYVRAFDDTTEEYVNGKLQVPDNVDTSGTVTFRAYVMAKTAAASKNVAMTFGHLALNDSESFDQTFTDEDSGDVAIDATQDDVTEVTWTETVTNLGWAANDLVLFRYSRYAASANNLSGDLYLFSLAIEIPRA